MSLKDPILLSPPPLSNVGCVVVYFPKGLTRGLKKNRNSFLLTHGFGQKTKKNWLVYHKLI